MSDLKPSKSKNSPPKSASIWLRMWPLYVVVLGLVAAYSTGLFSYLSLDTLRDQREVLTGFVSDNVMIAIVAYVLIYVFATVFMLPGALWITISGGFLFGLVGGSVLTILGATLGASTLFFAARTSIGTALHERAGPFLKKMEQGFTEDALSYMFALRFLPVVPFPVANIAPAILGAKYYQYLFATSLGIIPGVVAYTLVGAGLGATFDAGGTPDLAGLAKNLMPAFLALGIVSLIPVAWKKIAGRKTPV